MSGRLLGLSCNVAMRHLDGKCLGLLSCSVREMSTGVLSFELRSSSVRMR